MFKLLILFISILASSSVMSEADPTCSTQPQEIGRDMRILGFEGKFVGVYQSSKPAFYNPKLEVLYIFEDGVNSIPVEIPWTSATDLRGDETKSFSEYKKDGVKSYISSLGIRCGASGATVHPRNSAVVSNAKSTTCADLGQPFPLVGGKCCEGLTYNPNSKTCDEPSFKDPDQKNCTADTACSGSMGCLPQKTTLMFTKKVDNEETAELYDFMRELLDEQMNESEFLEVGKSCNHSSQCASYHCEGSVCQEAKVCRYGEEGEKVSTGTKCNEAKKLVKSDTNICELSVEARNGLFLGLYDEQTTLFEDNPEAGKCQYIMNEGVKERTIQAVKSMRAMEWLFSTISRSDSDDCFQVNMKLRDQIAKPLIESRKYLLNNFSFYYSGIKKDYETIKNALTNNQNV